MTLPVCRRSASCGSGKRRIVLAASIPLAHDALTGPITVAITAVLLTTELDTPG